MGSAREYKEVHMVPTGGARGRCAREGPWQGPWQRTWHGPGEGPGTGGGARVGAGVGAGVGRHEIGTR